MPTILTTEHETSLDEQKNTEDMKRRYQAVDVLCEAYANSLKTNSISYDKAVRTILEIVSVSHSKDFVTSKQANLIAGKYTLICHELFKAGKDGPGNGQPSDMMSLVQDSTSLLWSRGLKKETRKKKTLYEFQSEVLAEYGLVLNHHTIRAWSKK